MPLMPALREAMHELKAGQVKDIKDRKGSKDE